MENISGSKIVQQTTDVQETNQLVTFPMDPAQELEDDGETTLDEEEIEEDESVAVIEPTETALSIVNTENADYQEVKTWIDQSLAENPAGDSEKFDELFKANVIEKTLAATNQAIRDFNKIDSYGNGLAAAYAVITGIILNLLKAQVTAAGKNWLDFAKQNILGLSLRTMQKHMRIAKIRGVEIHLPFGIEKLNLLSAVVKEIDSDDPIAVFLSKYNVKFDPTVEMDFEDFKRRIDEITIKEKAAANNIDISEQTANTMAEKGVRLTSEVLANAKIAKQTGGDPQILFQELMANAKKNTAGSGNTGTKTSAKAVKSFNKLAAEFHDLIEEAKKTKDKEVLKSIDLKSLDMLLTELVALKAHLIKQ